VKERGENERTTITANVIINRNKEWNKQPEIKSGIEIEICQVRGIQYRTRRRLQYRDSDYNRYTVNVNNKINNYKSV